MVAASAARKNLENLDIMPPDTFIGSGYALKG
jgi:hypothetical protein